MRARAPTSTSCVAAFPSVTPVCAATIATGAPPGRAPHPVDELVPSRRGPLRRVRLELQRLAALRHQAVAHRHDLQHERSSTCRPTCRRCSSPSTTPTCAPPGTTYLMYRGRHRHEVSRETALDAARVDASSATPCYGPARALLRRHLRHAQDRLPLAARAAGHARPARRLRRRLPGRARPLRLPAALAARQRHALPQHGPVRAGRLDRGGRPPARAHDARRRRARRVPRRARDDRRRRPLAVAGRATRSTSSRRSTASADAAGAGARARDGERRDRALPVLARGEGLRARPRAPRASWCRGSSAPRWRSRASTS